MKKIVLVLVALAVMLTAFVMIAESGPANGAASTVVVQSTSPAPVSLAGHWYQTNGLQGVTMSADITSDSIQINMTMGTTGGIFWLGSFDTSDITSPDLFTVTSLGDQDAMKYKIFASSESSKVFNYKDGDLSYQFSIMGISTTVHLSRGAQA